MANTRKSRVPKEEQLKLINECRTSGMTDIDWCREHGVTIRELQERGVRAGVIWQDGEAFMLKDTIRMNLALPHSLLEEAMQRLKEKAFV